MIQFNLLPDVKLEYIKARRVRGLIFIVSGAVALVSIVILVILLGIDGLQKQHLSDISRDITSESNSLKNEPQLNTILTVQNQLQSLGTMHDNEPAASRLFDYLNQVTPAQVDISSFSIDFNAHTATITGTTDALSSVNQYVDTLKATQYTTSATSSKASAFSGVVLTSFGLSNNSTAPANQQVNYSIALAYDPPIFDITKTQIKLTVSSLAGNRSQVVQPTDLFINPTSGGKK
jgi:Tfp pilus assembly protein PilN